jgi:hypothetical protein
MDCGPPNVGGRYDLMANMEDLLSAIRDRLPLEPGKLPIVQHIELVWSRKLGATRGNGVLVVTTQRELTPNGGNGWTGFDGIDFRILDAAISDAVDEVGATGLVDRFIVRARRSEHPLSDGVSLLD